MLARFRSDIRNNLIRTKLQGLFVGCDARLHGRNILIVRANDLNHMI
ncbi:hypothetical protein L288_18050 [Sphingobium quisquiliarum P25]|uniref:Uncharacterized protein n=1 Tax=Sphingobium quisquiliarum P25 TaxID=1329909 RepID=T0GIT0_9SPHN|nr:hypothetical protein L288_18050 [Sphingobium quisquiliarum P25]